MHALKDSRDYRSHARAKQHAPGSHRAIARGSEAYETVVLEPTPVPEPRKPRSPRWNPPTRWGGAPARRMSVSPFVLLGLVAFAALAIANGWIDLDRWRELLG